MSGRSASGRRCEAGYASVYVALVVSLVLVPLTLIVIDFTTLAYWRAKLQGTADALAIGAVLETREFHIPIPTEFVGYFPVNGFLINALHLSNLKPGGVHTRVEPKLERLVELNRDRMGAQVEVRAGDARVLPAGNFLSPFMYVHIPVEAEVPLLTPLLGTLLGSDHPNRVTLRAESCAAAWYRPDAWVHRWWDADPETLVKTIDAVINVTDEPQKYYRLINCVDEAADVLSLLEIVAREHLARDPEAREFLEQWMGNRPQPREMQRARKGLERLPERCGPDDPCVDGSRESIEEWARSTVERRRAEEEEAKKREEAARRAAGKDAERNAAGGDDP
ncbi:hypothetical protein [Symbiobacterium thermophilum]|uniref:Uncharacterized protein n=2 Tax=Symbiobacterium thermophilum TaxID=2734 RepID=Q67SF5_SYMTH|nr:hypothetical protein [Symbiobacterium thermophilum]MBY6275757.1 hypothetical protein [Symbiobacterium thermophilum]BAD39388.1 hypothetical protein, glutamate-rich [Symbiobacterium thermophilum IAM 14863]